LLMRGGDQALRPPRELGGRESRLPLVLDSEGIDLRALGLRGRELGPDRVAHPGEPDRVAGLDPNGTMSSISKSIASPIRTLWRKPSSTTSIGARSTPSISPTSGARRAIGPPPWPPNTAVASASA